MPKPELFPIAYPAFVGAIHTLAEALNASGWRPDYVVGIGRGGLVPGAYLSHRTGIALLSIDHSSGVPAFSVELLAKLAAATREGRRILLADDINDTGATINALREALAREDAVDGNVRVAVLIDNMRSAARADYRARTIDRDRDKRWFVFPWETMAERRTLIEEAESVPERLA